MIDRIKILIEFSRMLSNLKDGSPGNSIQHTGMGAVKSLEDKFRKYYGYPYALTFSSATNALTAVFDCMNIRDSEVITSPFNYLSSIGGMMLFGNTAVFVDTLADLTINPIHAKKAVTKETKAILAVDFAGNPHDTFGIRRLCDEFNLMYIADAAQSFGAKCHDIPASSLADVLIVSLTTGKTLSSGEGACILIKDIALYEKLLHFTHPLRVQISLGLEKSPDLVYLNGRINPFSAILANRNFKPALQRLCKHQNKCLRNRDALKAFPSFEIPEIRGTSTFFYQFAYSKNKLKRDIIEELLTLPRFSFTIDFDIPFEPIYNCESIKTRFRSQIRIEGCRKVEEYFSNILMIKSLA